VYCGSGYRSSMAASLLERQGFREVYNVLGSITAWRAAGYPLDGQEAEPART
jgi:hydroxyacylglutathione hydrolase